MIDPPKHGRRHLLATGATLPALARARELSAAPSRAAIPALRWPVRRSRMPPGCWLRARTMAH